MFTGSLKIDITWTKEEILEIVNRYAVSRYATIQDLSDDVCQALVNSFVWNMEDNLPTQEGRMLFNDALGCLVEDVLEQNGITI